jgi:hypothetical protein
MSGNTYVGGSEEDPDERRQILATRANPGLLAAAIRDIAERQGVGTAATVSR